jgi:hypothetical protein
MNRRGWLLPFAPFSLCLKPAIVPRASVHLASRNRFRALRADNPAVTGSRHRSVRHWLLSSSLRREDLTRA